MDFTLQIGRKRKKLKDKTLREAIYEQNRQIIRQTLEGWSKAISGKLKIDHYRMLTSAFEEHLTLINNCIQELGG